MMFSSSTTTHAAGFAMGNRAYLMAAARKAKQAEAAAAARARAAQEEQAQKAAENAKRVETPNVKDAASTTTNVKQPTSNSKDVKQVETPNVKKEESNSQLTKAQENSTKQSTEKPVIKNTDTNKEATKPVKPVAPVQVREEVHYNNPINVYNWDGFTSAIRDKNVDAIVLNNDIYASGTRETAYNKAKDWGISRKVTITSKDYNHRKTINFGDHFLSFWDRNQKDSYRHGQDNYHPWDIVLKDVNITNTDQTFSPFFFNNESVKQANRSKITFDNVDQRGDMLLRSEQVHVELKNNVNVNDTLHNGDYSAIYAHDVRIAPNAKVVMNVRNETSSKFLHGNAAINIVDTNDGTGVVVGNGATLLINPNSRTQNTKGIIVQGNSDVILGKNANVQMNMGTGNSTAIYGARNLILNEGSNLDIKTLQDNNGHHNWGADNNGHHVSPITLGTNKNGNISNTLEIKRDASLKIVRQSSGLPVSAGLISFGSYGMNKYSNQNLFVDDGATLDLQDGAQSDWHEYGDKLAGYLGNKDGLYTTGLISMYGVDATDNVRFGNAKYVNLQRTGYQHGILLRLEGGSSVGDNTAEISAKGMPLKQWVAGNHSDKANFAWNIDYLNTQNKFGDYSYNYNGIGERTWNINKRQNKMGMLFSSSNSQVIFSDKKSLFFNHSDFNRVFNWWAPQRISFGTIYAIPTASVSDSNALVTHVNANVKQSPSLNTNNIELTWKNSDGKVVKAPEHYTINWVTGPNTSVATVGNNLNRNGKVEIIVNGEKQQVIVPVRVLGATVKNNGAEVDQNDPSTLPTAGNMTDISAVDRFGIAGVDWSEEPNISKPNPQSYGKVRVNYNDGTSQVINPYVDVRKVDHGKDHTNDTDIYLTFEQTDTTELPGGITQEIVVTTILSRDRITDYKYEIGDARRVTYTPWQTQVITKKL